MGLLRKYFLIMIAYGICLIASSVLSGSVGKAYADSRSEREYQIKAAFLYNFTKFVELPADRFADDISHIIILLFFNDPL